MYLFHRQVSIKPVAAVDRHYEEELQPGYRQLAG